MIRQWLYLNCVTLYKALLDDLFAAALLASLAFVRGDVGVNKLAEPHLKNLNKEIK